MHKDIQLDNKLISIPINTINRWALGACICATVLALFPVDYLYFGALRTIFFMAFLWMLIPLSLSRKMEQDNAERERVKKALTLGCGCLVVLYNPVIPVHLGDAWAWLAINCGSIFLLYGCKDVFERSLAMNPEQSP
ncbi:MAG: DUF6804 family protein [Halioglobus sp.]